MIAALVLCAAALSPHAAPPRGPLNKAHFITYGPVVTGMLYPQEKLQATILTTFYGSSGVAVEFSTTLITPDKPEIVLEWYSARFGRPKSFAGHFNPERVVVPGQTTSIGTSATRMLSRLAEGKAALRDSYLHANALTYVEKEYTTTVVITRLKEEKLTHVALSIMRNQGADVLGPIDAEYVAWRYARKEVVARNACKGKKIILDGIVEKAGLEGGFARVKLAGFKEGKAAVEVECLLNRDHGKFAAVFPKLKPGAKVRALGWPTYTAGKGGKPGVLQLQGAVFVE